MQTPDSNGLIDFNYFQIPGSPPNYEAGEYAVIVTWNNSFSNFKLNETGIKRTEIPIKIDFLLYKSKYNFLIVMRMIIKQIGENN